VGEAESPAASTTRAVKGRQGHTGWRWPDRRFGKHLLLFAWVFLPVQTNPNTRTHAVRVLALAFASAQFVVRGIAVVAVLAAISNGLAASTQRR
jgi:hypothetical protein